MKIATLGTKIQPRKGETVWTDDQIRWSEDENNIAAAHSADGDSYEETLDDDDEDPPDIFKPDPRTIFSFEFRRKDDIATPDVDSAIKINLQGYDDESDQIYVSTGLTLWRSAEQLCYYMLNHASEFQSKENILELGAGLGLNGILAHHLTAANTNTTVILTDGDTNALSQLRSNVEENCKLSEDRKGKVGENKVLVEQLIWGRESSIDFLERHEGKTFDVLLASDVVYVHDIIEPLWETADTLLSRDGLFYFAYCSRRRVPVKIESVFEVAESFGFVYECINEDDDVYVYMFRRKI